MTTTLETVATEIAQGWVQAAGSDGFGGTGDADLAELPSAADMAYAEAQLGELDRDGRRALSRAVRAAIRALVAGAQEGA